MIIVPLGIIIFNSENEFNKEWINQSINSVEFSSPNKLKLISSNLSKELIEYYDKLEIYSDNQNDKSIFLYSIELKEENIDLQNYYEQYLDNFKAKIPNLNTIEVTEKKISDNNISIRFNFLTNKKVLNGFCRISKERKNLNMFWLIPFYKSYSKEYIDKFDNKIVEATN
ncbi:hypothetical protein TSEDIMI_10028 [Tenacibaculum sediminilitoris]|uniref:hypothetical protein n=1 Tax=Tenacibaculum sediminilitoris TaxID=1820334 RepID=UPI0038965200